MYKNNFQSEGNVVIEEIGRNFELFSRFFGNQSMNQIRTFLERYDAQSLWNIGSETDTRGRDFESMVRKSVNIHSDVRQMLLLFSK